MDLYAGLVRPMLFRLEPETAHDVTMSLIRRLLRLGPARSLVQAWGTVRNPALSQVIWGLRFPAPVGLAAGLDKNGEAIEALAALGFSHVEIGTITAQAQDGNPRPRCFRLVPDQALVNRMGFNNRGAVEIGRRLARRYRRRRPGCVLGINIGKSRTVDLAEALDDHLASVEALAAHADYLVVNVSSPNTPGLRDLQHQSRLGPLLRGVRAGVDAIAPGRPLLLKLSPDLADADLDAAVDSALAAGIDGFIATNTTLGRDGLASPDPKVAAAGAGGLSGAPLRRRSTEVLARIARRTAGTLPIIGVGGVTDAQSAWEKICNGASLVQVYTGLVYQGPGMIRRVHRGLLELLHRYGLSHIDQAIGRDL